MAKEIFRIFLDNNNRKKQIKWFDSEEYFTRKRKIFLSYYFVCSVHVRNFPVYSLKTELENYTINESQI